MSASFSLKEITGTFIVCMWEAGNRNDDEYRKQYRAGITGEFYYSTLGIHVISEIIARTSGSSMLDFANKYLFEPLDIEKCESYIADNREKHLSFITARESQGRKWLCDKKGNAAAGRLVSYLQNSIFKVQ